MKMNKERIRTYSWENPEEIAEKAMNLSGYDFLKAMFEDKVAVPPILQTLNFTISEFNKGNIVFEFTPQEYHYNPIGSVHGGVITTILDSAIGCSLHSILPKNTAYTTLEIKLDFLKKITEKTGVLKTNTKIIHSGKSTAFVESDLIDESGNTYAHAVSTCMVFNLKK